VNYENTNDCRIYAALRKHHGTPHFGDLTVPPPRLHSLGFPRPKSYFAPLQLGSLGWAVERTNAAASVSSAFVCGCRRARVVGVCVRACLTRSTCERGCEVCVCVCVCACVTRSTCERGCEVNSWSFCLCYRTIQDCVLENVSSKSNTCLLYVGKKVFEVKNFWANFSLPILKCTVLTTTTIYLCPIWLYFSNNHYISINVSLLCIPSFLSFSLFSLGQQKWPGTKCKGQEVLSLALDVLAD
jgi:hypothetical protein